MKSHSFSPPVIFGDFLYLQWRPEYEASDHLRPFAEIHLWLDASLSRKLRRCHPETFSFVDIFNMDLVASYHRRYLPLSSCFLSPLITDKLSELLLTEENQVTDQIQRCLLPCMVTAWVVNITCIYLFCFFLKYSVVSSAITPQNYWFRPVILFRWESIQRSYVTGSSYFPIPLSSIFRDQRRPRYFLLLQGRTPISWSLVTRLRRYLQGMSLPKKLLHVPEDYLPARWATLTQWDGGVHFSIMNGRGFK